MDLLNANYCEVSQDFTFNTTLDDWHLESTEVREFYQCAPIRKNSAAGDLLDLPLAELCSTPSESTRGSLGFDELIIEQPAPLPVVSIATYLPVAREFIGTLTQQQRQEKLRRYLEKKQRRVWAKRIKYDCRKKVADNRVRVKGRFVSKAKAEELSLS
mmetsp:Transcript_6975/g.12762  ORF Transcript_6975/g.12762 Transcript_6975/m.12762 type:complete len:158 (-) Transcript_6975:1508-1981(-)